MRSIYHKPSALLAHFGQPALQDDLDTLSVFDDRTLASLAGRSHPSMGDGHDNDQPYATLPLERWRDR